jgi:HlyD family secretion protein
MRQGFNGGYDMTKGRKLIIFLVAAAVLVVASFIFLQPLFTRPENIRYITRPAALADIAATVNETGIINPVNQVQVGSEASGTILTLSVDYNSRVKKGQVLATLDPTTFQAALDSSQANLSLANANLDSAQANVKKAKASLDMANLTFSRDEPLA